MEGSFNCERCGWCCKTAGCSLLNDKNECTIYEKRPEICNIDTAYRMVKNTMTKNQWYEMNKQYCGGKSWPQ